MTGNELLQILQNLTAEQLAKPIIYNYYDTGDGREGYRECEISQLKISYIWNIGKNEMATIAHLELS